MPEASQGRASVMDAQGLETSVVVCTYSVERAQQLSKAVDSVRRQLPAPQEIIVVVDHAEDLFRTLRRTLLSGITLLRNDGPRGLSGARNTGIRASRGTVVAFLDDDAWAEHGWLANIARAFQDPSVAAVGGRIVAEWPGKLRPPWFPEELDWVVGCTYAGLPLTGDGHVRNVIGCNMAFRREIFEQVGYFQSSFGRVGKLAGQAEETELCLRVLKTLPAAVITYEPTAVVHHWVPSDRLTFQFLVRRAYNEGFWKGHLKRETRSNAVLTSEARYLRHLLTRFVPNRLSRFYRPGNAAQFMTAVVSLLAVGAGYLRAGLGFVGSAARSQGGRQS